MGEIQQSLPYQSLSEPQRAEMVRNAIFQLEQQRFEAEINVTILGRDTVIDARQNLTAQGRVEKLDEQITKLRREFTGLLDLYDPIRGSEAE